MNIFVLSMDVNEAARWHVDRHVTKMPLESAQLLCSNLNQLGVSTPYKSCHLKHPCTLWAGLSRCNYEWLCSLGLALCDEYEFRYGRVHACKKVIEYCLSMSSAIPLGALTPFAQAMPIEYKSDNALIAYRLYYIEAKRHLASWKKRDMPFWFI